MPTCGCSGDSGDDGYLQRVRHNLAAHPRQVLPPGPVPAAVLLPLFCKEHVWQILFTKRADHLNHHRGEISFPGGVRHPDDLDLFSTALRESWEEVGIIPDEVNFLGMLDDIVSVYGYLVTPYVVHIPANYQFTVNPHEIDRLIVVQVEHLLRPEIFRVEDWQWKGRDLPVPFFTYGEDEIWGLTAAILRQFLDLVYGAIAPDRRFEFPSDTGTDHGLNTSRQSMSLR